MSGKEARHPLSNLIPHATKDAHARYVVSDGRRGRVLEAPVNARRVAGEDGARLLRVVADRNDIIEVLPDELINRFGAVTGDVDSDLGASFNRLRANRVRARARAEGLRCEKYFEARKGS